MSTMMSHIRALAVAIAVCLVFGVAVPCQASEGHEYKAAFLARINEARQDPAAVAASLGITLDPMIARFPDFHDALMDGMPQLSISSKLTASAAAHVRDMLESGYYGKASQNGQGVEERMVIVGYIPMSAGDAIGMIGFNNFLDPDMAVDAIFENLFREQVQSGELVFLNPEYKDVGISFQSGTMAINGKLQNVYVVAIDLGEAANYYVERVFYRMLNDLRKNPAYTLKKWLGDDAFDERIEGAILSEVDSWYPPLAWDDRLARAARIRSRALVNHGSLAELPGSCLLNECIEEEDYLADYVSEEIVYGYLDEYANDPVKTAERLFEKMIVNWALSGEPLENMLSLEPTEVGIAFEVKIVASEKEMENKFILAIDYARPVENRAFLVGGVYWDINGAEESETDPTELYPQIFGYGNVDSNHLDGDQRYLFESSISGVYVVARSILDEKNLVETMTGPYGGYNLPIHSKSFYPEDWVLVSVEDENRNELGRWYVRTTDLSFHKDLGLQ